MTFVGVSSRFPPPTWNSENEQGWHVVHCASAAAIFIGWSFAAPTPSSLPTNIAKIIVGTSTTSARRADLPKTSGFDFLRRCQADTASMTADAVASDASSTCVYPQRKTGLV